MCKLLSILINLGYVFFFFLPNMNLYQTFIVSPVDFELSRGEGLIVNDKSVLCHRLQSLCSIRLTFALLLSVFVHHSTLPNTSPTPEFWASSNMFTSVIFLHFTAHIKFRVKLKDCRRCCLDHTVVKKKKSLLALF